MARIELREPATPMEEVADGAGLFDLVTVTGEERFMLLVLRGLFTRPGELRHRPDYGAGIQDYAGKPFTPTNVARIQNRVRLFFAGMPEVADHSITVRPSDSAGGFLFDLRVRTVDDIVHEIHEVPIEV